jgi:phage baseplate assembly protein W
MTIERERIFGNDLKLAEQAQGLDLSIASGGDVALASGNDNIIQALLLRLRVRKGELALLGWADYGSRLHELIGEPNNNRTQTILMGHARSAIEADPRVLRVSNIEALVLPGERDLVRLNIEVQLIATKTPLNLVFDAELTPNG